MFGLETIIALLSTHGLMLVGGLAIVEGPIVTVLAAWLASQGIFDIWRLLIVVIVADVLGDIVYYLIGRRGLGIVPARWRSRLGLDQKRLRKMLRHFRAKGGRTLVMGKLTHSAGAAILVAAGIARMPFVPFLMYNFIASIPKSAAFVALGYFVGSAYARIDGWIARGSLILLIALVVAGAVWWFHRRQSCPSK
ncbi:hypothetical protein BFP70_01255 [Thioclava sp. SK-1]|uniref:DedA family protein n=1 Tax=Thioclava sp. SK-1 TaxID=1889770 RepID=UPI000824E05F|nr:DedA family protein [Thioclava sp. SK-1]OCX66809.1 hypothetical protein BFP70_01255 [Thioclava sp. SK-1]